MAKLDELQELLQRNISKVTDLIKKEEEIEVKQKKSLCFWIFTIIGIVAVIAACAYGIYKFLTPDYLDDFDDDIDDFDDDFFDDDEDSAQDIKETVKEAVRDAIEEDKFED